MFMRKWKPAFKAGFTRYDEDKKFGGSLLFMTS